MVQRTKHLAKMGKWNDFRARREIAIDEYIFRRKIQVLCENYLKQYELLKFLRFLSKNFKLADNIKE